MLVSELSLTALLPSSLLKASAHGSLNTQKQMKINDCCCICVLILCRLYLENTSKAPEVFGSAFSPTMPQVKPES